MRVPVFNSMAVKLRLHYVFTPVFQNGSDPSMIHCDHFLSRRPESLFNSVTHGPL